MAGLLTCLSVEAFPSFKNSGSGFNIVYLIAIHQTYSCGDSTGFTPVSLFNTPGMLTGSNLNAKQY
jgi:hypothetical protein